MVVQVAVNGLGQIGRVFLRNVLKSKSLQVVAANDLSDPQTLAQLIRCDSIYGRFTGKVEATQDGVTIEGKAMKLFKELDPAKLPWSKLGVSLVVESTGVFREREKAALHLQAGAKKVIISAPGKKEDATLVLGVNHTSYDPARHHVVSMASCTTNCLAPVVKVLLDEYGIRRGFMSTLHAYTSDQNLQDGIHRDIRRARAAALNIIPTSTGAAEAIIQIFPQLRGKLAATSYRVPVADGSMIDLTVELNKAATKNDLNESFRRAAAQQLKGILTVSDDPLVSADIVGTTYSAIVDSQLTEVMDNNLAHIVAWYDNLNAYCLRLVGLCEYMASKL
jgi:glyceraldehyde 3-phosphate dehydrogenase